MNIESQPRWMRRVAAVLLLFGLLGGLAGLAAAPHLLAAVWQGDVESKTDLLTALERRAGDRDRLKGEQAQLAAAGGKARALLEGETFGLASANLQKLLVDGVQAAGLSLRSIQALEPTVDADFTTVPVRMVLRGTTDGMRALLHALETGEPLLFIDEALAKPERTVVDEGAPTGPIELGVELKVSGYVAGKKAP